MKKLEEEKLLYERPELVGLVLGDGVVWGNTREYPTSDDVEQVTPEPDENEDPFADDI